MTRLRKLMLDELQRRNYSQDTVRAYIHAIEDFAKYFHLEPYWQDEKGWLCTVGFLPTNDPEARLYSAEII